MDCEEFKPYSVSFSLSLFVNEAYDPSFAGAS